jgi:hypothetical protein
MVAVLVIGVVESGYVVVESLMHALVDFMDVLELL